MYTPSLPAELLRNIVESFPPGTNLGSMALVSLRFRDEAQRVLFQNPKIAKCDDAQNIFFATIISSPNRLALLVRRFTHNGDSDNANEISESQFPKALDLMLNLKHFSSLTRFSHDVDASNLFGEIKLKLHSFEWNRGHNIIDKFLPSQPNLKHLALFKDLKTLTPMIEAAAAAVCPHLESLSGPISTTQLFLPGRRITHLRWTDHDDEYFTLDRNIVYNETAFAKELQNIRYLEYMHEGTVGIPLRLIVGYLNNLQTLSMDISCIKHIVDWKTFEHTPTVELLSGIQCLETLIFTMEKTHRNPRSDEEYISLYYAVCKNLRRIYAPILLDALSVCYTNSSDEPGGYKFNARLVNAYEVYNFDPFASDI